ncbi:MAG TPA: glycoside hydrolase [Clostridiaceae bacterium]|nr:glycoside hydrolase [Clostridiaceae bacterium]
MKMALIGGGGVRTVFFTQSLSKYAQRLGINELVIMDNDEEKLNIYGALAQYIASNNDSNIDIDLTTDIVSAVDKADYVVATMRVGKDEGRIKDERIALRHGAFAQETTGPGGFSFALRTIPVMLEYCKIIKEKSNNAIVFNFTNPSGLIAQAMHDYGFNNVIGICDGPVHLKSDIASTLQLNINDLYIRVYGLNHLSWLDSVKVKGTEIFDKLIANDAFLENSKEFGHFDKDLIRMIKAIPNEYLYYYYYREEALRNVLTSTYTRGEKVKEINDNMLKQLKDIDVKKNPEQALKVYYSFLEEREKSYMSIELRDKKKVSKPIEIEELGLDRAGLSEGSGEVLEGYSGVVFNYIDAVNKNKFIDLPLNVPNRVAIPELKADDVVEITCIVDKDGAHPVNVDNIPEDNLLLIKQVKRYEKLTVEAAKNKSVELAIQALMAHPLVGSYSLAKRLVNDYLKEFREYLGEWR